METSTTEKPNLRYIVAAIAAGVSAVIAINAFKDDSPAVEEPGRPPATAQASAPGAPSLPPPSVSSRFEQCLDFSASYKRMGEKLGCRGTDFSVAIGICEAAYTDRRECLDDFEALRSCTKNAPESSWQCDEKDDVNLKEDACVAELTALRACGEAK